MGRSREEEGDRRAFESRHRHARGRRAKAAELKKAARKAPFLLSAVSDKGLTPC